MPKLVKLVINLLLIAQMDRFFESISGPDQLRVVFPPILVPLNKLLLVILGILRYILKSLMIFVQLNLIVESLNLKLLVVVLVFGRYRLSLHRCFRTFNYRLHMVHLGQDVVV